MHLSKLIEILEKLRFEKPLDVFAEVLVDTNGKYEDVWDVKWRQGRNKEWVVIVELIQEEE